MMDARGCMESSIGDVETSAHIPNDASAAAKPLASMMANGAAPPNVPVAAVSSGSKRHYGSGEDSPRMGITLTIVLSGRQPTAPLASPSH